MTDDQSERDDQVDSQALGLKLLSLTPRGQRAALRMLERMVRQSAGEEFSLIDIAGVHRAFLDFWLALGRDPFAFAKAQGALWRDSMLLWQEMGARMFGGAAANPGVAAPDPGDRRFKDGAWNDEIFFDYLKQSYLLTSRWMQTLVRDTEGIDPAARRKVDFYTRQFLSAMAPSNFAMTNPLVLKKARETGGANLVDGLEHLIEDLERGEGRLQISMTDDTAFEVGKNVATTPGKVVYQNELMQLIQYEPTTETVHKRPLLFVPPWINKFYVMDLQPRNSLIKWAVDQGYTLFVISWVNPRQDLAHKSFEDYMLEGPLAALDAMEQATGERKASILGFCIGGILTVAMLAYMAAKGDDRITSATFLATMVDLSDVGEASVFIDEEQLQSIEKYVAGKGYLEGHHMADMFSMMRENDLIWSFVVNNYLMGRDPMPFDMLYWNADSTRLPATMLLYYLRHMYLDNGLKKPGALTLGGVPIDIGKITVPCYFVATKEDHISPWKSVYPATQLLPGKVKFVLGGSGHIAGVINPPGRAKYGFWTNKDTPADADAWLAGATAHQGSWWPHWGKWLARRAGKQVPARHPGDGALAPIEDGPGSYVRVRLSE